MGVLGELGVAIEEWNFTSCTFQVSHVDVPGRFLSTLARYGFLRDFRGFYQSRSDQQERIDTRSILIDQSTKIRRGNPVFVRLKQFLNTVF